MSVAWAINGTTFDAAGIEDASVSFRTGSASSMSLQLDAAYDAAGLLAYGAAVTVTRNGTPFFRGKALSPQPSADDTSEGQSIEIVDAWQDLEDTIYQEPWSVGSGSVMLPIAILGVASGTGARITTSQQIAEAVNYAASAGVAIQMGSIPSGMPLWPSEVRNVSVAEVIRLSLRFHADWVPWIDHATTPPTLNITPRATLTARTLAAADLRSCNIVRRDELQPASVRIVYLNATIIDGVTYRDGIIDKFPTGGPDSGPRVLSNVIELAGGQMQFQKARIQTRALPTNQATAKTWLKKKFPHLKDVADANFTVTEWGKVLVPDTDDLPDPINPRAERLEVEDADDLPRELVRGTIEDWMRKKVGRVRITASIAPAAGATAAEKAAIRKGTPPVTVTATNAVTKIYKGITQFTAPEAAPSGIAQRIYESLAAYQHEGTVVFELEDAPATRYHGCSLSITGGPAGWATMAAAIHQVRMELFSGRVTLSVGPAPFVAADDFLELQRLFRGRPPTWMSQAERTSNELGAEADPGSKGDTVSGFDQPDTFVDPSGPPSYSSTIVPAQIVKVGATWKVSFTRAKFWEQSLHEPGKEHRIALATSFLDADPSPEVELASGENQVWLRVGIKKEGTVAADSVQLSIGAKPATTLVEPLRPPETDAGTTPAGEDGVHVQLVGIIDVPATGEPIWKPECTSARLDIFLPGIEFVGTGQRLYKEYDAATGVDKWRTVKNGDSPSSGSSDAGTGVAFLLEPVSSGTPIGDSLVIARLAQRSSEPQVKVRQVGSGMSAINLVEGNGKDGKRTLLDPEGNIAWEIEWKDGLVISEGVESYQDQVGSGSSSGSDTNLPP